MNTGLRGDLKLSFTFGNMWILKKVIWKKVKKTSKTVDMSWLRVFLILSFTSGNVVYIKDEIVNC